MKIERGMNMTLTLDEWHAIARGLDAASHKHYRKHGTYEQDGVNLMVLLRAIDQKIDESQARHDADDAKRKGK